jgi:hypothetical protein
MTMGALGGSGEDAEEDWCGVALESQRAWSYCNKIPYWSATVVPPFVGEKHMCLLFVFKTFENLMRVATMYANGLYFV